MSDFAHSFGVQMAQDTATQQAFAEALKSHGDPAQLQAQVSRLETRLEREQHARENEIVRGGRKTGHIIEAPDAAGAGSGLPASTKYMNVFVDGTLQSYQVYVASTSTFGPFA